MERLLSYFQNGLDKPGASIGIEVETSFVHGTMPITLPQSQGKLWGLASRGWRACQFKGMYVTAMVDDYGNKILYELGRQNLELAGRPTTVPRLISETHRLLGQLYCAAPLLHLKPYFGPIIESDEDLLMITDERDATWLELDGREALALLAGISAVQFTIEVPLEKAIACLNRLGERIDTFLSDYPQDAIWREYIRQSRAGYREDRYGGPIRFADLQDYCRQLSKQVVVQGARLVPFEQAKHLDIPLFLRSVWWYFRLKRYGNRLCIEVRPLARRSDQTIESQLKMVLDIMNL